MHESRSVRRVLHDLFEVSVIVKGIDGLLEILLGSVILFVDRHIIGTVIVFYLQHEFTNDPHDWLAVHLLRFWNHLTTASEFFIGLYFLANGAVKVILVAGLLKQKLWAYPTAVVLLSCFAAYEIFRYFHSYSLILLWLIAIDAVTVYLIWDEYEAKRGLR
ncbi:MAG: DUF2127 domain-containing protein [Patescibacteria group bacterium]|nr:DUF2127 domain-containing protein [Patescibacteria group bacterium]